MIESSTKKSLARPNRSWLILGMVALAVMVPQHFAYAQKQVVKSQEQIESEYIGGQGIRAKAFSNIPTGLLPLSPGQIKLLHRLYNRSQRAMASDGDLPPRPTSSSLTVDLSPGGLPPVVRLAGGYVTSLVFMDASGQPWPIQSYDLGNPSAFSIQWKPSSKESVEMKSDVGNTLMIQALTLYKHANLAVVLQGMNTPIMITLTSGQKAVDYRVDMHIPRMGPFAAHHSLQSSLVGSDTRLMDILNNVTPTNFKPMIVKNEDNVVAWKSNKMMYIRTPLTLISPGWVAKMSSSEGLMNAYKLPLAPVVLLLDNGKIKSVAVEEGV